MLGRIRDIRSKTRFWSVVPRAGVGRNGNRQLVSWSKPSAGAAIFECVRIAKFAVFLFRREGPGSSLHTKRLLPETQPMKIGTGETGAFGFKHEVRIPRLVTHRNVRKRMAGPGSAHT